MNARQEMCAVLDTIEFLHFDINFNFTKHGVSVGGSARFSSVRLLKFMVTRS